MANKPIDYWYAAKDVLTTGRLGAFMETLRGESDGRAYWEGMTQEKADANIASWNAEHPVEKTWGSSAELNAVEALSREEPVSHHGLVWADHELDRYSVSQDGPHNWSVMKDGSFMGIFDTEQEAIDAADQDHDADQDRLEHEQGDAAKNWSRDHAELERREFDQETHSERSRSEEPERGIEDDEELGL
jgi:hypothetical protein